MLLNRREIVGLVHQHAPGSEPLVIACIWLLSRCDPNLICQGGQMRCGLLQVNLAAARGILGDVPIAKLCEPATNIQIGAQLLQRDGLLVFLGREQANLIPAILQLEAYLRRELKTNQDIDVVDKAANP